MDVLIIQLIPKQFQQLKARYKGKHNLDYLPTSDNGNLKVISVRAAKADKVLLMTKFVSHKIVDHLPDGKTVYVNGGITDLLRTLKDLE